jgi:hypothetical protein
VCRGRQRRWRPDAAHRHPTVTGELAEHLLVTVEQGTGVGPEAPSCARFSRRGTSPYVYNTQAGGVRVGSLRPEVDPAFDAGTTKSLRVTVALPSATTIAGAAKEASFALNFRGDAEAATATTPTTTPTTTTPDLPGGIAPGTTGGFDKNGTFLTNAQIKKKLRIGRARLLKNGDVVVAMFLPAGGAIRAKVILPNGVYYGHTLLPEEWGPKVRVLLKRRPVGRDAVLRARRLHRPLVTRVTTRYRWAHGDDAYVEPSQKLTIVR